MKPAKSPHCCSHVQLVEKGDLTLSSYGDEGDEVVFYEAQNKDEVGAFKSNPDRTLSPLQAAGLALGMQRTSHDSLAER